MVTSGTYGKAHHLCTADRLSLVTDHLLACCVEFGWSLQAWAVLSNHYHFVAVAPDHPGTLTHMMSKMHTLTATSLNDWDGTPGRKVWFQYFESHITYPRSYYARLRYVHENAAHHKVVPVAEMYPWCSAAWFARTAGEPFRRTVESFKTGHLRIEDEFEVKRPEESGVKPPHSKEPLPRL